MIKRIENIERPYVSQIKIDPENHHLICYKSDGTWIDNGYFPEEGIQIHYRESVEHPEQIEYFSFKRQAIQ